MPRARRTRPLALAWAGLALLLPPAAAFAGNDTADPVAGAFVYPVGDELDFTKPHSGETSGFIISDSYLVIRNGRQGQRTHQGVDFSQRRGGAPVRAVASGVVVVADAKAQIRVRQPRQVQVTRVVKGKRVTRSVTRYRTTTKWRTGWGNYIVIRHRLPDGQTVHSLYGHLQSGSIRVHPGEIVAAGEVIAQVGQTGRATSPHLHLEIREAEADRSAGDDFDPEDADNATVETRTFALLATVDPISFLEHRVRRFEDLDPRSWESRYALAACRDGVLAGAGGDEFEPDRAITRGDYYAALASMFGIATGKDRSFASVQSALAAAGILNAGSDRGGPARDHLTKSEALELLLRCLDRSGARGTNLASCERAGLCSDFNRVFAGEEAAVRADREARASALAETAARRKAAEAEYARALKARESAGSSKSKRWRRPRKPVVKAVAPQPRLDPGFEEMARSDRDLTRAEACLLLASAFRAGSERTSALEQAATRVATASAAVR